MDRTYVVKLQVEVAVENQEDWEEFENSLEDSYWWGAFHDNWAANPYVTHASIDSFVEEESEPGI